MKRPFCAASAYSFQVPTFEHFTSQLIRVDGAHLSFSTELAPDGLDSNDLQFVFVQVTDVFGAGAKSAVKFIYINVYLRTKTTKMNESPVSGHSIKMAGVFFTKSITSTASGCPDWKN
jgi:hypothetical protein